MKFIFKPADFLFIILSAALIAISIISLTGNSSPEAKAVIKVKDDEYIYPLNQEQDLFFDGELGKSHIIIHDGCVEFKESPCRDKVCIHMGQGRKDGDFMACLPNRIIVTVQGGKRDTDN